MSKKVKNSRKFWIFYLFLVVFLCVFCIVGLTFVNGFLEDYESSQPYKVVEKYIEKLENGDYSYALGLSGFKWTDFSTEKECLEVLEERYGDADIYYLESSTRLGSDKVRYNLYADGERLGYVILSKTSATTKYGFNTWKIESCETFEFLGVYTVMVPGGYTLYADGKNVSGKYIIYENIESEYPKINGKQQPYTVTYEIGGFITPPEFTVESVYGEEYTKTVSEDGYTLIFDRKEVNYHEIFGFTRAAMEEYIHVISLEKSMDNYLQCVLEGSEYAEIVKNFNSAWTMYQPETESTTIENFQITRYEEYTSTQVLAEISFDYTVKMKYSSETYPSKYKVIYILTDDGWKIANMENI